MHIMYKRIPVTYFHRNSQQSMLSTKSITFHPLSMLTTLVKTHNKLIMDEYNSMKMCDMKTHQYGHYYDSELTT